MSINESIVNVYNTYEEIVFSDETVRRCYAVSPSLCTNVQKKTSPPLPSAGSIEVQNFGRLLAGGGRRFFPFF